MTSINPEHSGHHLVDGPWDWLSGNWVTSYILRYTMTSWFVTPSNQYLTLEQKSSVRFRRLINKLSELWGITYLSCTSICCCHASWMRSTSSAESRRPLFTWEEHGTRHVFALNAANLLLKFCIVRMEHNVSMMTIRMYVWWEWSW
jgi:hypothetical protein